MNVKSDSGSNKLISFSVHHQTWERLVPLSLYLLLVCLHVSADTTHVYIIKRNAYIPGHTPLCTQTKFHEPRQ